MKTIQRNKVMVAALAMTISANVQCAATHICDISFFASGGAMSTLDILLPASRQIPIFIPLGRFRFIFEPIISIAPAVDSANIQSYLTRHVLRAEISARVSGCLTASVNGGLRPASPPDFLSLYNRQTTDGRVYLSNVSEYIYLVVGDTDPNAGRRCSAVINTSIKVSDLTDVPIFVNETDYAQSYDTNFINYIIRLSLVDAADGYVHPQARIRVSLRCKRTSPQLSVLVSPDVINYGAVSANSMTDLKPVTMTVTSAPAVNTPVQLTIGSPNGNAHRDQFVIKYGATDLAIGDAHTVSMPAVVSLGLRGQGVTGNEEKRLNFQVTVP